MKWSFYYGSNLFYLFDLVYTIVYKLCCISWLVNLFPNFLSLIGNLDSSCKVYFSLLKWHVIKVNWFIDVVKVFMINSQINRALIIEFFQVVQSFLFARFWLIRISFARRRLEEFEWRLYFINWLFSLIEEVFHVIFSFDLIGRKPTLFFPFRIFWSMVHVISIGILTKRSRSSDLLALIIVKYALLSFYASGIHRLWSRLAPSLSLSQFFLFWLDFLDIILRF